MKSLTYLGLVFASYLAGFAALQQPGSFTRVQVAVADANGKPLSDVQVMLLDSSARAVREGKTDEKGVFDFDRVVAGTYRFGLIKANYVLLDQDITTTESRSVNVQFNNPSTYSFRLGRMGLISGRVANADGSPAASVGVQLLRLRYGVDGIGYLEADPTTAVVRTDDRGAYRLSNIPPGDWYLRGTSGAGVPESAAGVAFSYYPGKADVELAQAIHISPIGEELFSIDFRFEPLSRYKVSGTIKGGGDSRQKFYLIPQKTIPSRIVGPPFELGDHDPAPDRFELSNVAPGTYDLHFGIPTPGEARGQSRTFVAPGYDTDRVAVSIVDRDATNLELNPTRGASLQGSFVLDTDAAEHYKDLSRFTAALRPQDGRPPILAPRSVNPLKPTSTEGLFELQAIAPGHYYLLISVPRDIYVKSVKLQGREILGQPLDIGSQVEGPLVIEVSGRGATFSGTVKDFVGRLSPAAVVLMVPPINLRSDPESYRVTSADANGRFRVTGVRPGTYSVYAFSKIAENAWKNSDYMTKLGAYAISVDFKEREERVSDLRLGGQ